MELVVVVLVCLDKVARAQLVRHLFLHVAIN
jgi:hypothetical protein